MRPPHGGLFYVFSGVMGLCVAQLGALLIKSIIFAPDLLTMQKLNIYEHPDGKD